MTGWAAVGFDGYVDCLARVVRSAEEGTRTYFSTIPEFAQHIASMAGLSGDMEMEVIDRRYGGNAPLIAGALCRLGMPVKLVGAIDDPIFDGMPPEVEPIPLAEPGNTIALEFEDGKVMLAEIKNMSTLYAARQKGTAQWRKGLNAFSGARLQVLTNWSAMPEMALLWNDVFSAGPRPELTYLDLADPSKRSPQAIAALADTIACCAPQPTELGVNEKELKLVCRGLNLADAPLPQAAQALSRRLSCAVVVHGIGYGLYALDSQVQRKECPIRKKAALATGGGDHFSAAWCFARLQGDTAGQALDFANAASGYFVTTGCSPSLAQVEAYRKQRL